ncbi:hypothetical protein ACKFKG_00825 [Phormidesmis sp. 146-35]
MPRYSWFKVFRSLGLEFWLLLPVLGLLAWSGSGLIMDWVVSRSSGLDKALSVNSQEARIKVLSMQATIAPSRGISRVRVQTTHSKLKVLEYEFLTTQPAQIERQISQEMGLPLEKVKKAIEYRIVQGD